MDKDTLPWPASVGACSQSNGVRIPRKGEPWRAGGETVQVCYGGTNVPVKLLEEEKCPGTRSHNIPLSPAKMVEEKKLKITCHLQQQLNLDTLGNNLIKEIEEFVGKILQLYQKKKLSYWRLNAMLVAVLI